MEQVWPGLERKSRRFKVIPSHDIDLPSFYYTCGARGKVRYGLERMRKGDFVKLGSVVAEAIRYPRGGWKRDPFDTLGWIMDESEAAGLTSTFFYIPEQTDQDKDPGMPLDHPQVERQWLEIGRRGHELGVHPGFNTYRSPERMASGVDLVRRQFTKLGLKQSHLGSRQHCLRWCAGTTARLLAENEISYDTTLGFADQAGFRCGVCYEFPMYDLRNRVELAMWQYPLVVMDCSVVDERYMGLGPGAEAFDFIKGLKEECRKYAGSFTILWHNQRFVSEKERELYRSLLTA
jgi:hypothetical protein